MPTTYYQRNTAAPNNSLGIPVYEAAATVGTGSITVSVPSLGSETTWWAAGESGQSGTWTGTFNAQINVTTIGATITLGSDGGFFRRSANLVTAVSNSGTLSWSSNTGTGLKTMGFTGSLTGTNSTDRFVLLTTFANANMMSAESITFGTATTDSYLQAPWTSGPVAYVPPHITRSNPATPRSYTW